jgi:hypothetical protein
VCSAVSEVLRDKKATSAQKEEARTKELDHAKRHTTERRFMHERMDSCRANPLVEVMIYLDGMDQHKTTVPQLSPEDMKKFETLGMR